MLASLSGMSVLLTEQSVAEMAPNDSALLAGRDLVKKGKFKQLGKNDDGTLVFGQCQGSGSKPYLLSMDLLTGSGRPTLRCSCPSRQFPCKHQIGLMLAFVANGEKFPVCEPPADLLEKRAQLLKKAEKKAAPPEQAEQKPATAAAQARKVEQQKSARAKKTQLQSETLETLEAFLVDLISTGLGGLTAKNIKAIETQSKRMADADMRGALFSSLQHLAALVSDDDEDDDDEEEGKVAARSLGEARQGEIAELVTRLWALVQKGKKALAGKLEAGSTQGEADAQLELTLGIDWKLPELKEAGYWIEKRSLFELAHERYDDPITEFVGAAGYLLDLGDGSIVREWTGLPYHARRFGTLRPSRLGVVEVNEAALYPGAIINRRIRWDDRPTAGMIRERARETGDYERLHALAKPLAPLVAALKEQLKNPLHPNEAVVLLAATRFGMVGETLVAEDASGARLVLRDPPKAAFKSTRNARHAAAAFGPGSLCVRLYFDRMERAIYGQALALVVGDKHIRLGL